MVVSAADRAEGGCQVLRAEDEATALEREAAARRAAAEPGDCAAVGPAALGRGVRGAIALPPAALEGDALHAKLAIYKHLANIQRGLGAQPRWDLKRAALKQAGLYDGPPSTAPESDAAPGAPALSPASSPALSPALSPAPEAAPPRELAEGWLEEGALGGGSVDGEAADGAGAGAAAARRAAPEEDDGSDEGFLAMVGRAGFPAAGARQIPPPPGAA